MKTLELIGEVDEHHRLHAVVPDDVPPGTVNLTVIVPETNEAQQNGQAATASARETEWKKLRQLSRDCAVDTGIEDLAHQHDHYLYGTPKKQQSGDG